MVLQPKSGILVHKHHHQQAALRIFANQTHSPNMMKTFMKFR